MERHSGDVLRMSFQRLHTRLVLVVPYLDEAVVCAGDQVRLVTSRVVIQTVHALLVTLKCEIGGAGT